jgi:hypothetical protein
MINPPPRPTREPARPAIVPTANDFKGTLEGGDGGDGAGVLLGFGILLLVEVSLDITFFSRRRLPSLPVCKCDRWIRWICIISMLCLSSSNQNQPKFQLLEYIENRPIDLYSSMN